MLLILAGVSIATLTGQNGILAQANNAKEQTKKASIEEQRKLAQAEANLNITETVYNGVKIPANCAPIKISGGSTVDEGLVIIDSKGNEWVWIEVPKSIYTTATSNTDYDNICKHMQVNIEIVFVQMIHGIQKHNMDLEVRMIIMHIKIIC